MRDGCWMWVKKYTGNRPRLPVSGKIHTASRVAYMAFKGDIPDGKVVMHTCDNPECTNPEHLVLGTQADNMADMKNKKRANKGKDRPKSKLTEADVVLVCEEIANGKSQRQMARELGVSPSVINGVVNGKAWTHVTGGIR